MECKTDEYDPWKMWNQFEDILKPLSCPDFPNYQNSYYGLIVARISHLMSYLELAEDEKRNNAHAAHKGILEVLARGWRLLRFGKFTGSTLNHEDVARDMVPASLDCKNTWDERGRIAEASQRERMSVGKIDYRE
ncbi:unnamed protein product [Calypogeia fissa]